MVKVSALSRVSLGSQVASELRQLMAKRELERGAVLGEEALAEMFGVSRGPIRDALRILKNEGLVVSRGNRMEVKGLSASDIDELFFLRRMLELAALKLAMDRDRGALLVLLDEAQLRMVDAAAQGNLEAFAVADMEFHTSAFKLAGNSRLYAIWSQYADTIEMVLLSASGATYRDLNPSVKSHAVLIDLVRSGDPQNIEYELRRHLLNANKRARSFYEDPKETIH